MIWWTPALRVTRAVTRLMVHRALQIEIPNNENCDGGDYNNYYDNYDDNYAQFGLSFGLFFLRFPRGTARRRTLKIAIA